MCSMELGGQDRILLLTYVSPVWYGLAIQGFHFGLY
jgi:hypothetical protein